MPRNLGDVGTIDDEDVSGDAHRQQLADALPGNGVKVLPVADIAFAVDCPVEDFCGVVRFFRKRHQVWPLLLVEFQRSLACGPMPANIGNIRDPPAGAFAHLTPPPPPPPAHPPPLAPPHPSPAL